MSKQNYKRPTPTPILRRTSERESTNSILIICEGEKTEPHYFKWLREKLGLGVDKVGVIKASSGTDSRNIVKDGITELSEKKYDTVWCVFDTENLLQHNREQFLREAVNKAQVKGLGLAVSNPSFEYWFLLSYEETTKGFTDCDELEKYLKKHYVPDYDKATFGPKDLPPSPLPKEVAARAKKLHQQLKAANVHGQSDYQCNPSTTVYGLVEELYKLAQA